MLVCSRYTSPRSLVCVTLALLIQVATAGFIASSQIIEPIFQFAPVEVAAGLPLLVDSVTCASLLPLILLGIAANLFVDRIGRREIAATLQKHASTQARVAGEHS
jgi:hypothetical protein